MKVRKKNSWFGRYPACDLLNNALRALLIYDDKETAIQEIARAITTTSDGYFHADLIEDVNEIMDWELSRVK